VKIKNTPLNNAENCAIPPRRFVLSNFPDLSFSWWLLPSLSTIITEGVLHREARLKWRLRQLMMLWGTRGGSDEVVVVSEREVRGGKQWQAGDG